MMMQETLDCAVVGVLSLSIFGDGICGLVHYCNLIRTNLFFSQYLVMRHLQNRSMAVLFSRHSLLAQTDK